MPAAPPPATSGSFSPFSRQPPSSLQPAATHGRAPHKLVAAFSGLGVGGPGKRLSATAGLQDYRREFAGAAA